MIPERIIAFSAIVMAASLAIIAFFVVVKAVWP